MSLEKRIAKKIVSAGPGSMAYVVCSKEVKSPIYDLVWNSLYKMLPLYGFEALTTVYDIVQNEKATHIMSLKDRLLENIQKELSGMDDEHLYELSTCSSKIIYALIDEEEKRRRLESARSAKTLHEALTAVAEMDYSDIDDNAAQILEPWLDKVSSQNGLRNCLASANVAHTLHCCYHTEGIRQIVPNLYQMIVKRAKELVRPLTVLNFDTSLAKTLQHELELDRQIVKDVFGDYCTEKAISRGTIDEVLRERSYLIDEGTQLKRAVQLFNKGGDGSFDSLMVLYRDRKTLDLDERGLFNKLVGHVDECDDPLTLLKIYFDNWEDPQLKVANEAILKRIDKLKFDYDD
jgi:hypothetical protein